jgi:hypothetical protein
MRMTNAPLSALGILKVGSPVQVLARRSMNLHLAGLRASAFLQSLERPDLTEMPY